jgi:hypothetical protein
MSKRAIRAALAAACLASSQIPVQAQPSGPVGSAANPCADKKCEIHITVTDCSDAGIKLSQDPYHVAPGNKGRIHWIVDTAGFEFNGKGIGWKKDEGKKEFDTPDNKKKQMSWGNKHSKKGSHDYVIELVDAKGKTCIKDPTVVNG